MHCPCCQIELDEVTYEGFLVHHCQSCKGYLVRAGRLMGIKRSQEKGIAELETEATNDAAPDGKKRKCPECNEKMLAKLQPELGFGLDVCLNCQWTWFDGGELAKSQLALQKPKTGQDVGANLEQCPACGDRFRLWISNNVGRRTLSADDSHGSTEDYFVDVCPSCGASRPEKPFWEKISRWWRDLLEYG